MCIRDRSRVWAYRIRHLILHMTPPSGEIDIVLLNMYTGQQVRVLWNGIYSNCFSVSNGVKQGGIISPVLFCVYFDVLLLALRDSGVGCHIGQWFVGALAYADDIVLITPTARAMRKCYRY